MTQEIKVKSSGLRLLRPKVLSRLLNIKEPNIRRILSQGAKNGIFIRLERGVYTATDGIILNKDAEDFLKSFVKTGLKADFVYLDAPYNISAVVGGNRPMQYPLISVKKFRRIIKLLKRVISEDTPVVVMYSNAESGKKEMNEYLDVMSDLGFKVIEESKYYKLNKDKSRCVGIRGEVMYPEGVRVYAMKERRIKKFDYYFTRPRGYKSEKPFNLLKNLIRRLSRKKDLVLDLFAGSGVTGEVCIKLRRRFILVEKLFNTVKHFILPRIRRCYAQT